MYWWLLIATTNILQRNILEGQVIYLSPWFRNSEIGQPSIVQTGSLPIWMSSVSFTCRTPCVVLVVRCGREVAKLDIIFLLVFIITQPYLSIFHSWYLLHFFCMHVISQLNEFPAIPNLFSDF